MCSGARSLMRTAPLKRGPVATQGDRLFLSKLRPQREPDAARLAQARQYQLPRATAAASDSTFATSILPAARIASAAYGLGTPASLRPTLTSKYSDTRNDERT